MLRRVITYEDVELHVKNIKKEIYELLVELNDLVIEGRDRYNIPVYATKTFFSSARNIYLKTKRNNITDLNVITDYAGLRILCLFEKDIIKVHNYIITELSFNDFIIKELITYNWKGDEVIKSVEDTTKGKFKDVEVEHDLGYACRSIHYIVYSQTMKYYVVEIQLRTVLQDIKRELEYTKRDNVDLYVHLSHDLETTDLYLSHLKEINDKMFLKSSKNSEIDRVDKKIEPVYQLVEPFQIGSPWKGF